MTLVWQLVSVSKIGCEVHNIMIKVSHTLNDTLGRAIYAPSGVRHSHMATLTGKDQDQSLI